MRYTREELENLKDESDWARVDAMTDAEIEATALADPDYAEFVDIDWSKAELVHPTRKKPISIRLDEDIIAYFKKMGRGYQTRINAVLRSYMDHNIRDEG